MHHYIQQVFVFLVDMGFHHVGQAGLKLLTSGDLPNSASQSARITRVNHHAWSKEAFITVVGGQAMNNKYRARHGGLCL